MPKGEEGAFVQLARARFEKFAPPPKRRVAALLFFALHGRGAE
jgi:hypothetical protein